MCDNGLTCKQLVELMTSYLDGALAAADRRRFERHLATCAGCARQLAEFRQTIGLIGSLAGEAIEPATRESLLRLFRGWKRSPVSASSRPRPGRRGA